MAQALVSVGYTLLTAICISSFAFIFDAQASGFRAAVPFLLGAALTCSGAAVAAYVLLAGANALVPTSDHESVRENEGEPSPHHLAKLRRQRTSNAVDTHGNVVPVAERSPIKRTGKRTTCKRVSAETVISAHNASMARLPAVANDVPMEMEEHEFDEEMQSLKALIDSSQWEIGGKVVTASSISEELLERFLSRYRVWHIAAAEPLHRHLEWAAENLPIEMTPELKAVLELDWFEYVGLDVGRRPVTALKKRHLNRHKRNLKFATLAFAYQAEQVLRLCLPDAYQFVVLYDTSSANDKVNLDVQLLMEAMKLLDYHYPCLLHKVLVYPATATQRAIFKTMRSFLSDEIARTVVFVTNETQLEQYMPRTSWPRNLTVTDPGGNVAKALL